ncbi:MAG: hypothetical protein AAGF25_02225 [Pseudomonadota bacterium]
MYSDPKKQKAVNDGISGINPGAAYGPHGDAYRAGRAMSGKHPLTGEALHRYVESPKSAPTPIAGRGTYSARLAKATSENKRESFAVNPNGYGSNIEGVFAKGLKNLNNKMPIVLITLALVLLGFSGWVAWQGYLTYLQIVEHPEWYRGSGTSPNSVITSTVAFSCLSFFGAGALTAVATRTILRKNSSA